jgi:8-oxo-dGTP pyrophosphatase MutT (NUDIX family)
MEEQLRELLSKRKRLVLNGEQLRHSAVLVPLLAINETYHILFIRRSQQVEHHKGEISFPGGVCEKGDNSFESTALREAFEEVGIQPQDVVILGMVDDMETVSTRYRVTPVIGVIPYPYSFTLSDKEVDEILTVPVSQLLDGNNGKEESILREGKRYTSSVYRYRDYLIWGATARILKNFLALWKTVRLSDDTGNFLL